jgi:hypothetical protein
MFEPLCGEGGDDVKLASVEVTMSPTAVSGRTLGDVKSRVSGDWGRPVFAFDLADTVVKGLPAEQLPDVPLDDREECREDGDSETLPWV